MAKKSGFNAVISVPKMKTGGSIRFPKEVLANTAWDWESSANSVWATVPSDEVGIIKKVDAGMASSFGIKTDGSLWGWGAGVPTTFIYVAETGIYGAETTDQDIFGPGVKPTHFKVFDSCDWKHVSAGYLHNAAIKTDGTLWSWGGCYRGNLSFGIGCYNTSDAACDASYGIITRSPVQTLIGGSDWKTVAAGRLGSLAVKTDGSLWGWGQDELPSGIGGNCFIPQIITPPISVVANSVFETITNTMNGTTGLTMDNTIDYDGVYDYPDSGFWDVIIPWNIVIDSQSFDRVLVSTDSYLIFSSTSNTTPFDGNTEDTDYGFSAGQFDLPKIMIGAADRSANDIYYGVLGTAPNRTFVLRYEGFNSYSGGGVAERAFEVIFYEAIPSQIDIQIDPIISLSSGNFNITSPTAGIFGAITSLGFRIKSLSNVTVTPEVSGFRSVDTWRNTKAAVGADGSLWTWGFNRDGILGRNIAGADCRSSATFCDIGGANWKQVCISKFDLNGMNSCYTNKNPSFMAGIKTDGSLWTWGGNCEFDLGDGTSISRSSPVQVASENTNWKSVSVRGTANKAIKCDGTMWAWGKNRINQLGYCDSLLVNKGESTVALSPTLVEAAANTIWCDVSGAGWFEVDKNFAVDENGKLFTWGCNAKEALAHSTNYDNCLKFYCNYDCLQMSCASGGWANTGMFDTYGVPIHKVASATAFQNYGAAAYTFAGIKQDGTLWTWGFNSAGLIGRTMPGCFVSSPVQTLTGGNTWKRLSGGCNSFTAIKDDGTLWVWGSRSGELGIFSSPTQVFAGNTWIEAQISNSARLALIRSDGTLWTTGSGAFGFRGDNSSSTSSLGWSSPVQTVAGGTNWRQVSTSSASCCNTASGIVTAIKTDGTMWSWGNGCCGGLGDGTNISKSSPVQVFGNATSWKQVQIMAFSYSIPLGTAIKNDGTLWQWGRNQSGHSLLSSSTSSCPLKVVRCGATCWNNVFMTKGPFTPIHAINSETEHFFWGRAANQFPSSSRVRGCLDTTVTHYTPTRARKICGSRTGWTQVINNIGLKTDGSMFVWGCNESKRLTYPCSGPKFVFEEAPTEETQEELADFSELFVSREELTRSGLWATGWNNNAGRFGTGIGTSFRCLTQIDPSFNWKSISAYMGSVGAIKCDGTLWTWGCNYRGKLGVNDLERPRLEFTQVGSACDWKYIAMGVCHATAIKCDASLWSWGDHCLGRNGLNTNVTVYEPTQVGEECWNKVSVSFDGSAAIRLDGTLWTWGWGSGGALGNNDTVNMSSPVQTIAGGTNWCDISLRGGNAGGIKTDGTLWVWGFNQVGQLGIDNIVCMSSPVQTVAGGTNWKQICSYDGSMHAIKHDGTLWNWGFNGFGQIGVGSTEVLSFSSPVQTIVGGTTWKCVLEGTYNVFATKTDGTLWGWGYNTSSGGAYAAIGNCLTSTLVTSPVEMTNGIRGVWKTGSGGMYNAFIGIFESEADDL